MLNIVFKVIVLILIVFASLFILVFNGVKIDTLTYNDLKIKQLYIKYNKKLILNFTLESKDVNITFDTISKPTFQTHGKLADFELFKVKFNDKLKPLESTDATLKLSDDKKLMFHFVTAKCNEVQLYNSDISIDKQKLTLILNSHTLINDNLLEILKAYDITLDIKQSVGVNNLYFYMNIPFRDEKNTISVKLDSSNSILESYGIKLDMKKLHYNLSNDINTIDATDVNATYKDTKLFVHNIDSKYYDNKLINKANITYEDFNFNIDTLYDLQTNVATGTIGINQLRYKNNIAITNEKFDYKFDIQNHTFTIPSLDLTYDFYNNSHAIILKDLSKVSQYITFLNIKQTKEKSTLYLYTNDDFKNTNILSQNLNVLAKFLPSSEESNQTVIKDNNVSKTIANNNQVEKKVDDKKINIEIYGGLLEYGEYKLPYDKISVNIVGDKKIIKYKYKTNKFAIEAGLKGYRLYDSHLTAQFVTDFLNKKRLLENGYVILDVVSKGDDNISGVVYFHNTTLEHVALVRKLILFINTTPAIINPLLALPTLFRMKDNDFDVNGYKINKGNIDFSYNTKTKKLDLTDIYTRSDMMDFKAKAKIDVEKRRIASTVDVIFLKDYSNAIKDILLIGYILTGKDGNFVTQIDLYGPLDDPKLETHAIEDTASGVVNIATRILSLPFKALNFFDDNSSNEIKQKNVDKILNNNTSD